MKFLIQTINKQIVHDFSWELSRCEEYHKWIEDPITIRYHEGMDFEQIKHPDTYVPVGSVEFVSAYLNRFYPEAKEALKPLNVPKCLYPYTGRTISNVRTPEDFIPFCNDSLVFAKDMNKIKSERSGFIGLPTFERVKDCQVSSVIDFQSEWRVFVFQDGLLDCRCYSGDCFVIPSKDRIKEMMNTFMAEGTPVAYTLDVGVTTNGETVVIECHHFYSCGLYGFSQQNIYPAMLSQTWYQMRNMK